VKTSLKGSLGIDTGTGILLAVSGIAALFIIHNFATKEKQQTQKSNHSFRKHHHFNPHKQYRSAQDIDHHVVHESDHIKQRMGWTLPKLEDEDEREESIIEGYENQEEDSDPFGRVANSSYTPGIPDARGDGFAFAAGTVDPSGISSLPLTTTSPVVTGAASGTVPPSITATSTSPPVDPQLMDLQNRVLKMIIANTSNVQVILSSIDTIKAAIQTYTGRLSLLQQQQALGRIFPYQLTLYLMQIVNEIALQLNIPLKPVTMSPLTAGAQGAAGGATTPISGASPTAATNPYQAITAPNTPPPPLI
jgi:hypothetical protein